MHSERAVAFVFEANACGNPIDIRLCLLNGDTGLQLRQNVVVLVAPALRRVGSQRQRKKHVDFVDRSLRWHNFRVQHELRSQNTCDRERIAVENDLSPQDSAIRTEQAPPDAVAEENHGRSSGPIFIGNEEPSEQRPGAQHLQQR